MVAEDGTEQMTAAPVTAVIPTQGRLDRAHLLRAAVASVLNQTLPPRELVVVADSTPIADVERLLAEMISQPTVPVRVIQSDGVGAPAARNTGARAATQNDWIAYLDDDDVWLPGKTEVQLARLAQSSAHLRVGSGCVIVESPQREAVWPREPLLADSDLSEYFFCRRRWTQGDSYLQTSTLIADWKLLQEVPFDENLGIHQDWDWLLRCVRHANAEVVQVDSPVAIWRQDHVGRSVSRSASWRDSLSWASTRRDLFSPEAYAAFLLTVSAGMAAKQHSVRGLLRLWLEAYRHGRPRTKYLVLSIGHFLAPRSVLRLVRRVEDRRRRSGRTSNARS